MWSSLAPAGQAQGFEMSAEKRMARARTARFNDKRAKIVEAGARVLNRTGLSGLRLTEVAAETGLKRPSLVYYFANAEELAEAIYSSALDQIEQRVAAASMEVDPYKRLSRLIDLELAHHAAERAGEAIRRPQLGELRALSPDRRRALGRRYHVVLHQVADMLEVGQRNQRLIEKLGPAQIAMETVFWLPAWLDEFEPWMFDRVREAVVDLLSNGFAVRSVGPSSALLSEPEPARKSAIDLEDYLRAATRLICDAGFRGGAIDKVAARLGVTKGSFYHHLDEKEELIETCFAHSQERLSNLQRRASERGLPLGESVSVVLLSVVQIQLDGRFPLLRTSALPALSAEARGQIIGQSKRNFRWFASELAAGVAAGTVRPIDPHIAAQIVAVAANAVYDLSRFYPDAISIKDARAFCRMLERGILCRPA